MTETEKNERIKAVEEQMAKLQKELEDIRNSETREWDFSALNKISSRKRYVFDIPEDSHTITLFDKIVDELSKLMGFKFCYDRSYTPNWSNGDELKWYVYLDTLTKKYKIDWNTTWDHPSIVFFSSEEIARKCADWLNAGCPEE